jgi:hypothetical protein
MSATAAPLQLVGRLCALALLAVAVGIDSFAQEPQSQAPDSSPDAGVPPAEGGGVRAHTRLVRRSATAVTEEQASELTLTLTVAASRPIQTWIRTAGVLDGAGKVLTAQLRPSEAELVQVMIRSPHSWVHVEAKDEKGEVQRFAIEGGGAAQLRNAGVDGKTLKIGDKVRITGRPGRNAMDHSLLMLYIERPSDGWSWGNRPSEVVD